MSGKRTIAGIVGLLLVLGTLFGGNLHYLSDWSSAQLIGFNGWTIVVLLGGSYLLYYAAVKKDRGRANEPGVSK